jgi:hypothetical protein
MEEVEEDVTVLEAGTDDSANPWSDDYMYIVTYLLGVTNNNGFGLDDWIHLSLLYNHS